MSYLITLGSRPGDLVVDPFAGTCRTGMAAKMLGRDWLMIEMGEQWCQIGQRGIDAVQERLLIEVKKKKMMCSRCRTIRGAE